MDSSLMTFRIMRKLLQCLQVSVTSEKLRNVISEQLYEGSALAITDILNDLHIDSKVFQLNREDIQYVDCPVISHITESENNMFIVIVEISNEKVKYYDPAINKNVLEKKSTFFEKWTGAVIIPLMNEQARDSDYSKLIGAEKLKQHIDNGIYAGIAICMAVIFLQTLRGHSHCLAIWTLLFSVKMIALLIVSQIVKIELGESNMLIAKVCKTSNCGKVLHSKASRPFSWLTMGDAGAVYFGSGVFILLIAPFTNFLTDCVYMLCVLNLFTLPYTLFSICYQRFVLKTWCPFCLSVMGILWIEFFLGLTVPWATIFSFSVAIMLLSVFTVTAVTVGWLLLRKMLASTDLTDNMRKYVNTVKKDIELFNAVLSNRNTIPELSSFSNEIVLGNEVAKNTLIAVISPNCHTCVALYESIQRFLAFHSDLVKVILRFRTKDKEDDDWEIQIIDSLLTLNMAGSKEKALSFLEEWFKMDHHHIDTWKKRCRLGNLVVSDDAKQLRKQYQEWLLSVDINEAPFVILNNKQVPRYYTFNDVKYFLKKNDIWI